MEANMPDIAEAVIKKKETKISSWPVKSNYASEAGHPCERYLFYQRTAWDKKEPHDVALQFIFDGGNDIEEQAIREIKEAGYHVVEQQRPFVWKEFQLSGRIDARVQVNGRLVPMEIKGYAHHDWSRLDSINAFLGSKRLWHRNVPAQILLYQMMSEEQWGLIYVKSKSTYMPRTIWVNLYEHLEYIDSILQKLTRVNRAVEQDSCPARIEYDETVCLDCSYFTLCQPGVALGKDAALLVDSELEEALERREELKPLASEYKEVDQYVKKRLKGCEKAILGKFLITGKEITGDRKPSPGGSYTYWRTTIARIPDSH